jgi:dTDP-4-dehydrorhamnose reductase
LSREVESRGHEVIAWRGRSDVDLTDEASVGRAFDKTGLGAGDAVVNAAAMARVGDAYSNPELARAVNVEAVGRLARLCAARGVWLVHCSTDMVFEGERVGGMYREEDEARPVSVYGRTKLEGEAAVLGMGDVIEGGGGTVCRLSLLYGLGLGGSETFMGGLIAKLRSGESVTLFDDEWRTPLTLGDAAAALVRACEDRHAGLYHLGGAERMSRYEMGLVVARALGVDEGLCRAVSRLSFESAEPRQRDLSLNTQKAVKIWGSDWRGGYTERVAEMVG